MKLDPSAETCTLSSQHGTLVIKVIATAPTTYFSAFDKDSRRRLKLLSRPAVVVASNRVVVLGADHVYDVRLDGKTPYGRTGKTAVLSLAGFVVQTEDADRGIIFVRVS